MSALVSRETLLAPVKPPEERVSVPEFGDGAEILVVGLTTRQRNDFDAQFLGRNGQRIPAKVATVRERIIIASCRNDDGTPVFTTADIPAIGNLPAAVTERIVDVAQRLSGFRTSDIDQTAKNSDETCGA